MEQTNEVKVAGGAALHVASGAETEANEITRANQF